MPEPRKSWYALATPDDGPAEVMIYDDIGMFGITAADFVRDVGAIKADAITVRINSYGGDVFEGIAILNAIRGMGAAVTVVVDGIAASIASVIATGGDKVVMNQNSQMMIHNAWNLAAGNADELQRVADGLRSMSGNIATIYAAKAGGTAEEWQARMNAETWYTAEEAVAAGLADEVISEAIKALPLAGVARASASLMHFKYPGREAAPAPTMRATNNGPSGSDDKEGNVPSEKVLERLGLPADATDDDVLAALDARDQEANADAGNDGADEPQETELAAALAAAERAGMVLVPQARFQSLEAQAAQGATALENQITSAHAAVVDGAISQGKITAAERDSFMALMKADATTTQKILDGTPAEARVPLTELGHSTEPVTDVASTPTYQGWKF